MVITMHYVRTGFVLSDNNAVLKDTNGNEQSPCTDWDCGDPPVGNTCRYSGSEFACMKDTIIPYMKSLSGQAAFVAHIGDMLKGVPGATNTRCTDYALGARKDLFDGK